MASEPRIYVAGARTPPKGLDSAPLQKLGWKPKYDLRQGLEKTYAWYGSG
jgi:nucleoside-diphosphate-sugar epimerase